MKQYWLGLAENKKQDLPTSYERFSRQNWNYLEEKGKDQVQVSKKAYEPISLQIPNGDLKLHSLIESGLTMK